MSAPLTLDEVREIAKEWEATPGAGGNESLRLCATIEWLVERIEGMVAGDKTSYWDARWESEDWLRGEA